MPLWILLPVTDCNFYDCISYHTGLYYLPCGVFAENHFIKEESMTTKKILYFFLFYKIDFVKKGISRHLKQRFLNLVSWMRGK